jgi:hypothetical protein
MRSTNTHRQRWLLGLVCLWLTGGVAFSAEKGTAASEYQIKAALVYNLTKFTVWPTNAFASADAPIIVGILGDDPFGRTLDDALDGEACDGHPIKVERLKSDEELKACHILFISKSEKIRLKPILSAVSDRPILTIGDTEGFGQTGGMVNLLLVDKSIRFEINAGAAQQSGVKISSKLLNLPKAIKVETRKE